MSAGALLLPIEALQGARRDYRLSAEIGAAADAGEVTATGLLYAFRCTGPANSRQT